MPHMVIQILKLTYIGHSSSSRPALTFLEASKIHDFHHFKVISEPNVNSYTYTCKFLSRVLKSP